MIRWLLALLILETALNADGTYQVVWQQEETGVVWTEERCTLFSLDAETQPAHTWFPTEGV